MNRRPEPFDADERALAELLARDALPGPSPQLDARILAAARAAAATPGRASQRLRPRWIAGMGIAASLVLAIGIAWRLRPLPERPVASEAPPAVSAMRVVEPAHSDAAADAVQPPAPKAMRLPSPPTAPVERERAKPARRKPAAEPEAVHDEPAPMESAAPPAPPAPPPPPPLPAQMAMPKPAMNAMAAPAAAATQAAEAQRRADSHDQAESLDRIEVTGSRLKARAPAPAPRAFPRDAAGLDAAAAADAAARGEALPPRAVLDEEPPATADSPLVRDAWLQRIRELLAAGDTEAARGSLAEFRRRYPNYALPEDLQPLAK
jgi:hypothetical protein